MNRDILESVFGNESLDLESFEKRLASKGGFHLVNDEEFSALSSLSQKNRELESELLSVKNESRIELLLSQTRAKNIKAARAMLDESSVYDENGLNDELLSEHTEKLKRENPWLFEDEAPQVRTVSTFLPKGRTVTKDASRMSDEEFYKNIMKTE
ncbi:MAG: hypothetical protein E7477_01790 [Ruminococcaceae bacterium]|nr:hypothetical protein [Oscillospiraceae bacterium]